MVLLSICTLASLVLIPVKNDPGETSPSDHMHACG